ncbi:PREDICTED: 39S ribosomal protein L3, mitochondrial [Ceratosolen solmsi marchali]|uniref:Large ribosomal subunit protein uL3m n=1 Tax=Ceratosolen solmsi marchali TaxID=326594 RepID=A0AAJ6YWT0_9HYME|nr:PREDICTED: 39S ribosomal protein L3, mitochondrial [Ceratosolen solmsi marchali]
MNSILKVCVGQQAVRNFLKPTLETFTITSRGKKLLNPPPRKRLSPWLIKQNRVQHRDDLTPENKEFIQQVIKDKYAPSNNDIERFSPLKLDTIEPITEWQPHYRRVGVIAKKIGIVPLWLKNGKKIITTMLQVSDNHVIKYIPPEEYKPMISKRKTVWPRTMGCLIVGAESCDPQLFTKEYCGLFNDSGVMPKRLLARFSISPEAALQPGTPLSASHFQIGDFIDIRGKTIDRGFQGVMKRWGFHGMPASHGVTKTHRRPGNIGSGSHKARVLPGTKMPGHMGNRYRIIRGQRIIRMNTKYNIIWIHGDAVAGATNSFVQIYDTVLPFKTSKALNVTPRFPTYFPNLQKEALPEELFADDLHNFADPTIIYTDE